MNLPPSGGATVDRVRALWRLRVFSGLNAEMASEGAFRVFVNKATLPFDRGETEGRPREHLRLVK